MRTEWNTGRLYVAAGQIIRAKLVTSGDLMRTDRNTIYFNDTARGIWGALDDVPDHVVSELDIKRYVMSRYDMSKYRSPRNNEEYEIMSELASPAE